MTKQEIDEMAALVVRLRKELEHTTQHLVAHIDALTKSNAQCGEYLRTIEQFHSELVAVRAELASATEQRDSLKRTLQEWEEAETKPQQRIPQVGFIQDDDAYFGVKLSVYGNDKKRTRKPAADIADHVVPPVVPMPAAKTALCTTCHGCGKTLLTTECSVGCYTVGCRRTMAVPISESISSPFHPYYGPCPCVDVLRHG